jgi:anion-transporting  ArsA/GET3 family ATPase
MTATDYQSLIENRRIVVVCGSGGVGKTTISAAIVLAGAMEGKRTLALTIDPARRLASALGLKELGNEATPIDDELLAAAGIKTDGQLFAMMLDTKTAWDSLIRRFAPNPAVCDRIFANRLYQNLSAAFSGAQDYAATETLYELATAGDFDLIVLDTPPAAHALDFLDAPNRLVELFNDNLLRLFLRPTTFSLGLFSRGSGVVLAMIERLTGVDLIREISEFFMAAVDLITTFRERSDDMVNLLKDERTNFLVVTGPDLLAIEEAVDFRDRLKELEMPFGGFIINRTTDVDLAEEKLVLRFGSLTATLASQARETGSTGSDAPADRLLHNYGDWLKQIEAEQESISRLREVADQQPLVLVPRFYEEISDLSGVARLASALFGSR